MAGKRVGWPDVRPSHVLWKKADAFEAKTNAPAPAGMIQSLDLRIERHSSLIQL